MLTAIEEDRIEAAVAKAEEGSSGEILCVLAREVSQYREIPLAWAAAASLALPPLVLALTVRPLANLVRDLWVLGQSGALETELSMGLSIYALLQCILFVVVFLIVSIPGVRRRLTPRLLKNHRVVRAAHRQFAAISARAVGSETGVMIFVALDDRQVRILADDAIHQKVGDPVWNRAAAAIGDAMKRGDDPTAGIIEAVEICGDALREHFPASGRQDQVFSNRPLEV